MPLKAGDKRMAVALSFPPALFAAVIKYLQVAGKDFPLRRSDASFLSFNIRVNPSVHKSRRSPALSDIYCTSGSGSPFIPMKRLNWLLVG